MGGTLSPWDWGAGLLPVSCYSPCCCGHAPTALLQPLCSREQAGHPRKGPTKSPPAWSVPSAQLLSHQHGVSALSGQHPGCDQQLSSLPGLPARLARYPGPSSRASSAGRKQRSETGPCHELVTPLVKPVFSISLRANANLNRSWR